MTDSPLEDRRKTSLEKKPVAEAEPARAAEVSARASDADRDRVADILREALAEGRIDAAEHSERIDGVYAAKTLGELGPLVRDLPQPAAARRNPEPAPYAPPPQPHHGSGWKDNLVAIFSGSARKGGFRVPHKINAFALFGGIEIDLTEAVFEHRHLQINATAIFGSIEVKVPENVTLQQKGAGIFGSFDVHAMQAPDPDAPVVLVEGAGIFGSVDARPKRGRRLRDMRGKLRKEL